MCRFIGIANAAMVWFARVSRVMEYLMPNALVPIRLFTGPKKMDWQQQFGEAAPLLISG
jgi:hypothetical protein